MEALEFFACMIVTMAMEVSGGTVHSYHYNKRNNLDIKVFCLMTIVKYFYQCLQYLIQMPTFLIHV